MAKHKKHKYAYEEKMTAYNKDMAKGKHGDSGWMDRLAVVGPEPLVLGVARGPRP